MSTPTEALDRLDELARELDQRSRSLHQLELKLEPVQTAYEEAVADYETSLWDEYQASDNGGRWPSEALREKLARRSMEPAQVAQYDRLRASRGRLEKRIAHLRGMVDAQRSILSALKLELEATR